MGLNKNLEKGLSLEINSKLENVSLIGSEIKKICQDLHLSTIETYEIELCVIEACTNVIRHAYKEKPENILRVTVKLKNRHKLIFKIYDCGDSMDPQYLYRSEPNISKFSEGGRGLLIITKLMDEVNYETKDKKNILTMIKNITPSI